jgi:hypothetical protein
LLHDITIHLPDTLSDFLALRYANARLCRRSVMTVKEDKSDELPDAHH